MTQFTVQEPEDTVRVSIGQDGGDVNIYLDGTMVAWLDAESGCLCLSRDIGFIDGVRTSKDGSIRVIRA